jgi:F-type H+-transporting ATPase subunit b
VLIDWFTVIAQIVNFLILVGLLRYFLFTPITRAMRERREKIGEDMDQARRREEEAVRMLEDYRRKSLELERMREEIIHAAQEEARKRGDEHLRKVHAQAAAEQERLRDALMLKKRDLAERLRTMALHDAAGMARSTLAGLSGADIEDGLVEVFIRQIGETGEARRSQLAQAMSRGGNSPAVKSSFPLKDDQRRRVTDAIRKGFSPRASVQYERAHGMVLGIEMDVDGYTLRWGVDQYLGDIESEVSKAIADAFGSPKEEKNA